MNRYTLTYHDLLMLLFRSAAFLCLAAICSAADATRHFRAKDVFDYKNPILFQDNFQSSQLSGWEFSENDQYRLAKPNPEHLRIVDAPGLEKGHKAMRFFVERGPNSFRSELSLPHEEGFQERWYAERILIPEDWVFDAHDGNDIVMQWHAIPGNGSPTYPNLQISIDGDAWFVRQSFGNAQEKPTRTNTKLAAPVKRGAWVAWIIHAKWAPDDSGIIQVWKDGDLVLNKKGPNVYSTIGVAYTPYLKTGIYHPEWHLDKDRKKEAFEKAKPLATQKLIYATDIKVGDARVQLESLNHPSPP